jgi:hypothetical protein
MYKIYDFRCTNGHVFEEMVEVGTTTSRCGCGALATKMVSAPSFHLDGATLISIMITVTEFNYVTSNNG